MGSEAGMVVRISPVLLVRLEALRL